MPPTRRGFLSEGGLILFSLASRPLLSVFPGTGTFGKSLQKGPAAVKRWAMVVNLTKCASQKGCRDCIKVCHEIHNVPDFGNEKDEIKWIWTVPYAKVFPEQEQSLAEDLKEKPTIVFCDHCDNPPCVKVCPTGSTWRREDGVVMIDYHRCIGCRYCMAGCPYGSRSFNWKNPRTVLKNINPNYPTRTKGVVEKCNFCVERLDEGLLPACVEACPEKAMLFGDLNAENSELKKVLKSAHVVQRQPELGTKPSIYYVI